MAHYVNIGELDQLGIDIHDYAAKEIRGEIDRILTLGDKYLWVGKASDAFFSQYKEIMTKLYDYSDMIETFGYFLRYVAEGYDEVGKQSSEMFKNYVDEKTAGQKSYLWERG